MSKAWIEDLWLTEPRETLPDGSKVKIPVPSSVTKSLAAYMKTPEKAKVPGKFKTARYGHGKRWRVSWWATLPDGSKKRSSKAFSTRADAESFAAAMEDDIRSGRYVDPADADRPFQAVALEWLASKNNLRGTCFLSGGIARSVVSKNRKSANGYMSFNQEQPRTSSSVRRPCSR